MKLELALSKLRETLRLRHLALKTEESYTGRTVALCEEQRQAVILALARLAVERPGWKTMLEKIAEEFAGKGMFAQFVSFAGLPPMSVVDSSNRFGLVRTGDKVVATSLNPMHGSRVFTLFEAVILAVWAAKLADPDLTEFHRLAKEISK